MIVLAARAALGRLAFRTRFLFFVGIAVTAMAILTIHKTPYTGLTAVRTKNAHATADLHYIEMETGGLRNSP